MGSGLYLRVERDGKWESVEIEDLTKDELNRMFVSRSANELVNWIEALCKVINEQQYLIEDLESRKDWDYE